MKNRWNLRQSILWDSKYFDHKLTGYYLHAITAVKKPGSDVKEKSDSLPGNLLRPVLVSLKYSFLLISPMEYQELNWGPDAGIPYSGRSQL